MRGGRRDRAKKCAAACRRAKAPAQLSSRVFDTLRPSGAQTWTISRRLARHTLVGVQHAQAEPSGAHALFSTELYGGHRTTPAAPRGDDVRWVCLDRPLRVLPSKA